MLSHVIFDLDGTLLDSLGGIEHAAREAVAAVLPGRTLPPLASWIGPPIGTVLARALGPLPPDTLEALVAAFRARYDADGWRRTQAYPGVPALLSQLMDRGLKLAVVTNKPQLPTMRILTHLALSAAFEAIVTPDAVSPPYRDKTAALGALVRAAGIRPAAALFVGDSRDDRLAAEAWGLGFVAATYGYGGEDAAMRLGRPLDLIELVARLAPTEVH